MSWTPGPGQHRRYREEIRWSLPLGSMWDLQLGKRDKFVAAEGSWLRAHGRLEGLHGSLHWRRLLGPDWTSRTLFYLWTRLDHLQATGSCCPQPDTFWAWTHLSLCVLSVAQELLLEKHHFLGQHGDYPVEDPGYMNYYRQILLRVCFMWESMPDTRHIDPAFKVSW